jgi:hypothetical protein
MIKPPTAPKPPPPPPVNAQPYILAHAHASKHRAEIEASARCACFFCFRTFAPSTIKAWIEGNQTALCPHCGIDAVLGTVADLRIDDGFLRKMHQHHFAYRSK